ncbi:MAG: hypothetical protein LDL41_09705 [Coleofasciculus sp. S288]|nr:hypothetical protein [Coleofasciculus sp. S288]
MAIKQRCDRTLMIVECDRLCQIALMGSIVGIRQRCDRGSLLSWGATGCDKDGGSLLLPVLHEQSHSF